MSKRGQPDYWAKLIGRAAVFLPGVSSKQLRVQLFDVLDEFFNQSCSWRESIDLVVIPETLDYPITPTSGRIVRLDEVTDQHNTPQQAVMPEIGVVHFLYPFSQIQTMTADVIKTVTDPFNCSPPNVPEWLLPSYGLGILYGIVGHTMLHPGMSYSNPQMGNFYLQKFSDLTTQAYVSTNKMNKIGAQTWSFPQQFRVRGQRGGVSTFNVHPFPPR
jgi:hypothetical protein